MYQSNSTSLSNASSLIFDRARWTLTFWYVVSIGLICGGLSLLFYVRTSWVLQREYERIEDRLQHRQDIVMPPVMHPGTPTTLPQFIIKNDIVIIKQRIALQLLFINCLVILSATGVSFVLAGATLAPIKKSLQDQQRFVGDAAHELKTPITALKTLLEVHLLDPKMTARAKPILQEALESVDGLQVLTHRLLTLARAEFDATEKKNLVPVSSKTTILKAIKLVTPLAEKKQLKIIPNFIDEKIDSSVLCDEADLLEIIIVLLDNAIKYSHEHQSITISLAVTKKQVKIIVTDMGVGITAQELPHVFERFYRADSSRSKQKNSGFGLGLSVAKQLAHRYGGDIVLQSPISGGTTATVLLPKAK